MQILFFLLSFCFSVSLFSVSLPEKFSELSLVKFGLIYFDKKNELTIEKLLYNSDEYPFEKPKNESSSFGYLEYPVWFKISLLQTHKEKEKYIIDIPSNSLDSIFVYEWNPKTNSLRTFHMGDRLPFKDRPIEHTTFAFTIELEKNVEKILFFRFQSESSITFPIQIYEEQTFHAKFKNLKMIFGIYYGFMLGLLLYNLFLAFQLLEPSYFFYEAYMLSLVLLMSTGLGHSFEYLWQNSTEWNSRAFSFFNGMVMFFSSLFTRAFLKITGRKKFLNLILLSSALIGLGFSIYSLFGNILISNKLVNAFSLFGMFVLGVSGVLSLKHENRLSKLFLLAWSIMLFFSFFVILRLLGFLPRNVLTYYGAQIGSLFEALLLSFSLADKIKQLEKEKEQVIQEQFKFQIQIQENLEQEVRRRSEQLQKHTISIQQDMEMAKRIQSKFFPSKNYDFKNFSISSLYYPKDKVGGDFYNVYEFSEEKLRIFIADATGHGVQAAFITMTIKSEYESLKEIILDPAEVLENLYQRFFDIYKELNLYFTSFILDIDLQKMELSYASVGHPSQYIFLNNNLLELSKTTSLVKVLMHKSVESNTVSISKPSKLILFTDGIFEEFNSKKEQYGEIRLQEKLSSMIHLTPNEICKEIFEDVRTYAEQTNIQDDITIIAVQVKP